jgi:hypothetical protein
MDEEFFMMSSVLSTDTASSKEATLQTNATTTSGSVGKMD